MKVVRSFGLLALVSLLFVGDGFAASRTVTVLGQVRKPGIVELNEGDGLLTAVRRAGGLGRMADFHRVTVRQNRPDSAIRSLVVDLERLEKSSNSVSLESGSVVVVPEVLVALRNSRAYRTQQRRFQISEDEARRRVAQAAKEANETSPADVVLLIGDYYWFGNRKAVIPDRDGWYVHGVSGKVSRVLFEVRP